MPLDYDGMTLVVEPRYPNAEALAKIGGGRKADTPDEDEELRREGVRLRNSWFSERARMTIFIWEEADGRIRHGCAGGNHSGMELSTIGASDAWGIEQEARALRLLGDLVTTRQLKHYLLTGMFIERSQRSGVCYIFRKLRPTLALREDKRTDTMRILAALCLHPIAYYRGSWAGSMCPTDDVIAHLSLMRGDEHMFWRRANQHGARRHEAGV